ncbi:MAG: bifunctional hydroxymethylpyrimidine kinase/phosphomethylpyrimidine kinase [Candidatus Aminicenantes bacterium]|nr:bifunctional hydroxymethylpyrimidine kinase/phosphomethylpyrimidine kinase [Candidatus Aminicenantes bacterium]
MKEEAENLKKILANFAGKKIVVWGDLILDEYIYTTTGRVSREAPVLVTELESKKFTPGGAGNVVMNVKSLGACPIPVSFTGNNPDGKILKEILKKNSISTDYLLELENYDNPKKSRILSGSENTKKQQVLRIDTLNKTAIEKHFYREIESSLLELLQDTAVLIISDYLYESVKADILKKIKEEFPEQKIIIDSRSHLLDFKSVTYATPNEPEMKNMFPKKSLRSEEDFFCAGEDLLNTIEADGVILKRGHKGMIVFEKDKEPRKIDIHGSAEIVDGTGAGDTVISVVSLALAAGADLFSSAHLANAAAGLVVMKEGAYPVTIKELQNEFE